MHNIHIYVCIGLIYSSKKETQKFLYAVVLLKVRDHRHELSIRMTHIAACLTLAPPKDIANFVRRCFLSLLKIAGNDMNDRRTLTGACRGHVVNIA